MNKKEHLFVCLNEEAVEIAHITDKILRFGLNDSHPDTRESNYVNLITELYHLSAILELLEDEGISLRPEDIDKKDFDLIVDKKERVKKYMMYARGKGTLNE